MWGSCFGVCAERDALSRRGGEHRHPRHALRRHRPQRRTVPSRDAALHVLSPALPHCHDRARGHQMHAERPISDSTGPPLLRGRRGGELRARIPVVGERRGKGGRSAEVENIPRRFAPRHSKGGLCGARMRREGLAASSKTPALSRIVVRTRLACPSNHQQPREISGLAIFAGQPVIIPPSWRRDIYGADTSGG